LNDVIFSIDPGSIRSGWCVMKPPEELVRFGLLLPERQKSSSEVRINDICLGLWPLLDFWRPGVVLVEWTSGRLNRKRHSGSGQGLGVHGAATGALYREAVAWLRWQPAKNQLETKVVLIKENDWSRGIPKRNRAIAVAAMFTQYKIEDDQGGDIADAVGLAIFYLRENLLRAAELVGAQDKK